MRGQNYFNVKYRNNREQFHQRIRFSGEIISQRNLSFDTAKKQRRLNLWNIEIDLKWFCELIDWLIVKRKEVWVDFV
jgi:hypothetical protein